MLIKKEVWEISGSCDRHFYQREILKPRNYDELVTLILQEFSDVKEVWFYDHDFGDDKTFSVSGKLNFGTRAGFPVPLKVENGVIDQKVLKPLFDRDFNTFKREWDKKFFFNAVKNISCDFDKYGIILIGNDMMYERKFSGVVTFTRKDAVCDDEEETHYLPNSCNVFTNCSVIINNKYSKKLMEFCKDHCEKLRYMNTHIVFSTFCGDSNEKSSKWKVKWSFITGN